MRIAIITLTFCLWMGVSHGQDIQTKIPVDSAGYMALINEQGQRLTDWKYLDDIKVKQTDRLLLGKKRGVWGLLDDNLNWILLPRYTVIEKKHGKILAHRYGELTVFSEMLDTVKQFEHVHGMEFDPALEKPSYRFESAEYCQRIILKTSEGTGVVDLNYDWLIKPVYDDAFFSGHLVFLRKGEQFGFVAANGKVVEPEWSTIGMFNPSTVEVEDENGHRHYFSIGGEKIPYTDSTLVIETIGHSYKVYQNGKGEIYDRQMKKEVNYRGEDIFTITVFRQKWQANRYSDLPVEKLYAVQRNGKMGVIDGDGRTIISANYENITYGGPGFFIAMTNGKFGVINEQEQEVIPFEYTFVKRDGDYFKLYDYRLKGYADLQGDIVVPVKFTNTHIAHGGFITEYNGRVGFFRSDSTEILPPAFERAYYKDGGLVFVRNNKSTMVNKHGLLTPIDCDKVSRNNEVVKYYTRNRIYVHYLEDDTIADTTIYPLYKKIVIDDRWSSASPIQMPEPQYQRYLDQLTGKIGSIRKFGDGWQLEPEFFNIHHINGNDMAKVQLEDYYKIDHAFIHTKEVLVPFYGSSGAIGEPVLAYLSPGVFSGWNTSQLTPCLRMNWEWDYYSKNAHSTNNFAWIMKRYGYGSVSALKGEVNFNTGQDIKPFRELYDDMNSGLNYKITTSYEFDRLSRSPMLKIKDPLWQVLAVKKNSTFYKTGTYEVYEELPSGRAIFKEVNGLWGIHQVDKKPMIDGTASKIIPVFVDEFEYYLVEFVQEDLAGISDYSWTIYTPNGDQLPEYYDAVSVVTHGYFRVRKGDTETLINKEGEVIYTYSTHELVSEE